ncbi:MAG: penicillin acylase family protein [Marivibrio sp.]|uniref:penicillin acylase family protein n=1 Tax=Marivibrio sp. TaxID=2039719 RepID=UPI0032EEEA08
MLRWTGRLLLAFLLLLAIAAAGGFLYLRQSLPQTEGERGLAALDAAVEVTRDAHGVPTIRAQGMADAYRALGFLHAQDRLWQMETARRFGRGTLSEVAGRATLRIDRFARALDLEGMTRRQMDGLPDEVRVAVDAYAEGVNAFLAAPDGPLPPEFLLTGVEPAPWEPLDSLLWGKLMALQLSGDWRTEQEKSKLLQRLPPARVADLMPSYSDSPASLTAEEVAAAGPALERVAALPFPPDGLTAESASNAWAVAGSRTESGAPMLANDPHLRLALPPPWYLARIETPELTLVGATAPGVPFHIIGHNGEAAWGLTTTHADTMDLIALAPDPEAPEQRYLTAEGSRLYRTETEEIPLRGGESETFERRWTLFGPVLPDQQRDVALQWSALRDRDDTPSALYRLNRAKSVEAFQAAARLFDAPVQNLFWANGESVATAVVGRFPIRAEGRNGALPRISTAEDARWLGITAPEAVPVAIDPPNGLIANANNRILTAEASPYRIAGDWQPPHRYARVREMLESAERPHDAALSAAVQTDATSRFASALVPHLLRAQPTTEAGRRALARLAAWDHVMAVDAAGPAIFAAAADELARVLAEDDLGPAFMDWWRAEPGFLEAALTDKRDWCDDLRTPGTEDCIWALSAAVDRAAARLAERLGEDVALWRWGDLHVARMGHTTLTFIPVVNWLTDRPLETPGGDHTPNRGQTRGPASDDAFSHVHGAGMRVIYDLADLDRSDFALAGGQSGHFLSPHYADRLVDWRDGRYFRIPGRSDDIDERGFSRLILRPE